MARLNQIIAVANGKKSQAVAAITELHHKTQKAGLTDGLSRRYRPKDDDGDKLPPESKKLQLKIEDCLKSAAEVWSDLFDVVATQDKTNTVAKADVVVNGEVLLVGVPVTTLLFIEKQLIDVGTFISKLPVLDPSEDWSYSAEAGCYVTKAAETIRTKKVPKNHVKAEATKEHPAQVEVFNEDVLVGYWESVKFSGALSEARKQEMLNRVRQLQDAVKCAREEANNTEIVKCEVGKAVFSHLFENGTQS